MKKLEDYKGVAINCETGELAKMVLKIAHEMGGKWSTNKSFLDVIFWDRFGSDTCYWIYDGIYGDIQWADKKCYKIITAEEFLAENTDKRVYYRGVKNRGEEIIKALEELGGVDLFKYGGSDINKFYYIAKDNIITYTAEGANESWLLKQFYTEAFIPGIEREVVRIGDVEYYKDEFENAVKDLKPIK